MIVAAGASAAWRKEELGDQQQHGRMAEHRSPQLIETSIVLNKRTATAQSAVADKAAASAPKRASVGYSAALVIAPTPTMSTALPPAAVSELVEVRGETGSWRLGDWEAGSLV